VTEDDKIWSGYSLLRSVDVESLMFCVFSTFKFYLFVCRLVCLLFVFQWSDGSVLVSMVE
jgi:hypothetical protein